MPHYSGPMIKYITLHTLDHASFMIATDRILRRIQTARGSQIWLGRRMDCAEKVLVVESVEEIAKKLKEAANDTLQSAK